MKNKKTAYIWIIIVINIIWLPVYFLGFFTNVHTWGYIQYLSNALNLMVSLIWLYKAFLLKKDLIKWTNISFGLQLLSGICIMLITLMTELTFYSILFGFLILIIIWITFVRHLRKAISANKIQLN